MRLVLKDFVGGQAGAAFACYDVGFEGEKMLADYTEHRKAARVESTQKRGSDVQAATM